MSSVLFWNFCDCAMVVSGNKVRQNTAVNTIDFSVVLFIFILHAGDPDFQYPVRMKACQ